MNYRNYIRQKNQIEVITNVGTRPVQYYIAIGAILIIVLVLNALSYRYLLFVKEDKERAFVEGREVSIRNFLIADLKIIFNEYSNLNQLSILKNYSHTIVI